MRTSVKLIYVSMAILLVNMSFAVEPCFLAAIQSSEPSDYVVYDDMEHTGDWNSTKWSVRGDRHWCSGGYCWLNDSNMDDWAYDTVFNNTLIPSSNITIEIKGKVTYSTEGSVIMGIGGNPAAPYQNSLNSISATYPINWGAYDLSYAEFQSNSSSGKPNSGQSFNTSCYFIDSSVAYCNIDGYFYNESHATSKINLQGFEIAMYSFGAYNNHIGIDSIFIYYGDTCPTGVIPDNTPPSITGINCTSNPDGSEEEPYNSTGDLTPTFNLDTDESSTCSISTTNTSYTVCTTTGSDSHVCTLPFNDSISCGSNQKFWLNCTDSSDNSVQNESDVWACDSQVSGEETNATFDGFCTQYVTIDTFTGTSTTRNLTVECFNPNTHVDFPSVTVTPPSNYGTANTMKIGVSTSNYTVFSNTSLRDVFDGELYTISSSNITGNITMSTNTIQEYNRVDPVYAFTKDGLADCRMNTTTNKDLDINFTLQFFNTGNFIISSNIIADNKKKNDTLCTVKLDSGTLKIDNT